MFFIGIQNITTIVRRTIIQQNQFKVLIGLIEDAFNPLFQINNYIWYFQGKTRTKPWNLVRKFKLRWRVGYPLMATLRLW